MGDDYESMIKDIIQDLLDIVNDDSKASKKVKKLLPLVGQYSLRVKSLEDRS